MNNNIENRVQDHAQALIEQTNNDAPPEVKNAFNALRHYDGADISEFKALAVKLQDTLKTSNFKDSKLSLLCRVIQRVDIKDLQYIFEDVRLVSDDIIINRSIEILISLLKIDKNNLATDGDRIYAFCYYIFITQELKSLWDGLMEKQKFILADDALGEKKINDIFILKNTHSNSPDHWRNTWVNIQENEIFYPPLKINNTRRQLESEILTAIDKIAYKTHDFKRYIRVVACHRVLGSKLYDIVCTEDVFNKYKRREISNIFKAALKKAAKKKMVYEIYNQAMRSSCYYTVNLEKDIRSNVKKLIKKYKMKSLILADTQKQKKRASLIRKIISMRSLQEAKRNKVIERKQRIADQQQRQR